MELEGVRPGSDHFRALSSDKQDMARQRLAAIVLLALPLLAVILTAQSTPELVLSVGHAGAPDHMIFVGNYLATSEWSNVNVIDLASGLTVARLPQGSLIESMDGSRDGDLLAIASCGDSIDVWSLKSRTLLHRFAIDNECAEAVAISADGAFVAGSAHGIDHGKGVRVWDLRTGSLARELLTTSVVRHLVFSGDGRWLAAIDEAGKATVFEWPSARVLQTINGLDMAEWSDSFAFASRDGRYLGWHGGGLRAFEIENGREIPLPGARTIRITDRSPDGTERERTEQQVVAGAAAFLDDGRLAYIDDDSLFLLKLPEASKEVRPLPEARSEVVGDGDVVISHSPAWLAIARDGRLVAGSGDHSNVADGRSFVWDVAHARLRELTAPGLISPESLQWSRRGLIAWSGLGRGVQGWDERSGRRLRLGDPEDSVNAIAFSSDGATLAASGSSVWLFDAATGRELAARDGDIGLDTGVSISSDGARLAFTPFEGFFGVFDRNFRIVRRLEPFDARNAEHVAFSPDGSWVAADFGSAQPTLRVWPAISSGESVTLDSERTTYGPQPPAFSADSRRLASFVRGTMLVIWSTATWNHERSWSLSGTGRALAFAPEGSRLAIASDGEAAIWDADTGRKLVTFSSPGSSEMKQIAWSPDGNRVVTAADDGVLRFWRADDGRLLGSLYMFEGSDDWLLVTPDGRLDGSDRALKRFVAWRVGERVRLDGALTRRHRVAGLWRALSR
jgi:WD40 repeat protein